MSETGPSYPPSQEEIDKMNRSRTISDADLLKGGAEFENNNLAPTAEQRDQIIEQHEKDEYDSTPEHQALMNEGSNYQKLQLILGTLYGGYAMNPRKGEATEAYFARIRNEMTELLRSTGQEVPTTRTEGEKLFRDTELRLHSIPNIDKIIRSNPSLRIGATVRLMRSDGTIQSGWQIENITSDGYVRTTNSELGLYKYIPITELDGLNPA